MVVVRFCSEHQQNKSVTISCDKLALESEYLKQMRVARSSSIVARVIRNVVTAVILAFPPISFADNVFGDSEVELSFRYPENWSEQPPQMHSTLVLLYAQDGSDATCNIAIERFDELVGLADIEVDKLRASNHKRKFFESTFGENFPNAVLTEYWRGYLGQKEAGFAEIEHDLYVNDKTIRLTQLIGATFANERRITLICNSPSYGQKSAKNAFNYIQNTLFFIY